MTPFFVSDQFIQYLRIEKRYSEHTLIAYSHDLNQFLEHAAISKEQELQEVNHGLIRSWIVALKEEDKTNKTINRKLACLRTFFKWLRKTNLVSSNPLQRIQGPKTQKKLPVFAREQELREEKLENLFTNTIEGLRDRLIFELFYQTGIRLSELIELQTNNVSSQTIKVRGKRNKERIIPVSHHLTDLINQYNQLIDREKSEGNYLILTDQGKKLYPKFVYRKINYYLSHTSGLDVNSPHVLRHTFATHMLNHGAGLETLKELLGHTSLAATQVYTHNSFAQLTNIYSSAHPRGRKKDEL